MTANLVKLSFVFNALSAAFGGLLINFFENHLPAFFSKLYRHGKFCANVQDAFLDKCEVPKRWFKHFYLFSAPLCIFTLWILFYRYYLNKKLPEVMISSLNYALGGPPVPALVPVENAVLAMILFTIHCCKRFYESHYVSVFSDASMNFSIYLIGLMHYLGTTISIVGETQNLYTGTKIVLDWTKLTYLDILSSLVLLIATYVQFRTNVILSNLRKDKNGKIVTKKYKLPRGELFNYITAPLQFTEIIIYLSLTYILRSASTFYFVTFWVVINQMECAYLSHEWSSKTFKDYPKSRKIIIPFIF